MISQKAKYAFKALFRLAEIPPGSSLSIEEIATAEAIPRRFLEHKDKVLVNVLFRGRELQHIDEGKRILDAILEQLNDVAKIERGKSATFERMLDF